MDYEEALKHMHKRTGMTVLSSIANDDMQECISFIKKETSCDDETAKLIWYDLKMEYGTKEKNPILRVRENKQAKQAMESFLYCNNAECPYCHSKNTKKISGISKVGSVAIWGVFAMNKVGKQWHCNNCNSDF